jgi:hypothetical protein
MATSPANIVNVTAITGNTTYFTPTGTTAVVLLANAASSTLLFKINQIVCSNVSGSSAVNATVSIYNNATVTTQGNAPSGGTAFPIISTISVPASASVIAVDKTTAVYLMEGQSIVVTSGTANGITYTISYESIQS